MAGLKTKQVKKQTFWALERAGYKRYSGDGKVEVYPHSETPTEIVGMNCEHRLVPYKTQQKDNQRLLHKGPPLTKGVSQMSI